MKVAITWSTWFVWKYLVYKYAWKWDDVIAFWRKPFYNFENSKIKYIQWDITQKINKELLKDEKIDLFIHSASDTNWKKSVEKMIEINTKSIANVLDFASEIPHIFYISTSAVYQWIESWNIKEDIEIDENNLNNSYALSKYLAEKELIKWCTNKLSIIRPRAIYWKWDRLLIPAILQVSFFNKLIIIWKWNKNMSVTHVDNLYQAIDFLYENQKIKSDIFNITDWTITTMKEVYNMLVKKYTLKWIIYIPVKIITFLKIFSKNKFSYMEDIFTREKVLNIDKIMEIWFIPERRDLAKVLEKEY